MKVEKIQAAKKRILALLCKFPYWKETTLERFLIRKQHVMSRGIYLKAIRGLLNTGDLVQPRAGVICYCSDARARALNCGFCEQSRVDLLVDGEPTSSPVVVKTCEHRWGLILADGTFSLTCSKCKGSIRAWCSMPTCLSDVLATVAQLPRGGVNEERIKQAAEQVCPNKARAWDTFATIKTVLAMKTGRAAEGLWIKSKILCRFIETCKNDSGLAMLSRSTQRRYSFVIRALQGLPLWFQP